MCTLDDITVVMKAESYEDWTITENGEPDCYWRENYNHGSVSKSIKYYRCEVHGERFKKFDAVKKHLEANKP